MAAPMGGHVTAGTGSINQSGATTTVHQSSQNLSLSWKSFNVAANETVNFKQPNSSAVAVNRIHDTQGSTILGHINANGNIYLINPNGIVFGPSAQVNVGGLVASTLDTADGTHFSGSGTGSVVNEGTINAQHYVALLGNSVTNSGVITARLGTVAMGAGDDVSLSFSGNNLIKLQVNRSVINALVANHGLIEADGGMVVMNAGARDTLLASVVNNDGVVQAQTVQNKSGTITLLGGMAAGTVNVGGTLDASAPAGGNGGHIETSAAHVHVAPDANITTASENGVSGGWLIDPVDFTIAASGGDMTGSQLSSNLSGGSVTIQSISGSSGSSGDINVNDAVSWSANTLTLKAQNDINIKANLNGSGTAKLALQYGQSSSGGGSSNYYLSNGAKVSLPAGSSFSTKLGSGGATTSWTVITQLGSAGSGTATDLQGMKGNLAGNYALGADIDASATSGWNSNAGFEPVGTSATKFTGSFAGLGHTISNLHINRSSTGGVGLFGNVNGGTVRDVGLVGGSVSGNTAVGDLVGYTTGPISNSYATGSVSGSYENIGGLVGQSTGTISDSYATGSVSISASISGSGYIGGLVGQSTGTISDSYATGNVSVSGSASSSYIGGLVGLYASGTISNSYATGNISINASVNGSGYIGGLVGQNSAGTISNSYATGSVSGSGFSNYGGLVGYWYTGSGTVANSYWDTTTSGASYSAGGTGLTTTQMQNASNFSGWSIATSGGGTSTWRIYDGQSYPLLDHFLTPITVTANDASKVYDGLAYSGGNGVSDSVTANSTLLGSASYSGTSQGAVNAGSYVITPSGYYSTSNQGYDVSYANGTLTVNKASLTVTANNASKTYDGLAYSGGNGVSYSGFVHGEGVSVLGGTLAYGGSSQGAVNAGSYAIAPSGLTSSNYAITFNDGTLTVGKGALTVTANNASRFYDGLAWSGGNGVAYSGFVHGETSSVLGGTLAYGGSSQGAVNAGSYAIAPFGLTASNYTIGYVGGRLTIDPSALSPDDMNADTAALSLVRQPQRGGPGFVNASPQLPAASGGSANGLSGEGFLGKSMPMPAMTVQLGDSATLHIMGGGLRLPSDSM